MSEITLRVPPPDDWPEGVMALVVGGKTITREEAENAYARSREKTPRERLKEIVDEIAAEARERIDDPKNVEKGDGWTGLRWSELQSLIDGEVIELEQETFSGFEPYRSGPESALKEAGDVLAVVAMYLDKFRAEGGK